MSSTVAKFYNDLIFNLSKVKSWETVFRIRCSAGWKKNSFGNYFANTFNDLLRMEQLDECTHQKLLHHVHL